MSSFVSQPKSEEWKSVLNQYDKILTAKAAKMKDPKGKELLKELHAFVGFQHELSAEVQEKKQITYEQITKLMKWKLTRGKFRPRLQQMVESNPEEEVTAAGKAAFKAGSNVSKAISALTVLKAIGPATASAILTAGNPETFPFMADESMLALGIQPLKYTLPAYTEYTTQVRGIRDRLKEQDEVFGWTCHSVELALWSYHVGKQLLPDSIEQCVAAKAEKRSSETEVNGDTKKKKTR